MPQYNNSAENVTKILTLFTDVRPRIGISEFSRELGLSKTTAFNLVRTLVKEGFLAYNEEVRKYELGKRIANLAYTMSANLEINQKGAGIVQELSSSYGFTCHLGIWGEGTVIVIFSCSPSHSLQLHSYQAGPTVAAYCSALGRAMLAYMERDEVEKYLDQVTIIKYTEKTKIKKTDIIKELDKTKARGFSTCDREISASGSSFGAPVFDRSKYVAGAISILGYTDQILSPEMKDLPGALCFRAHQISQSLGYGGSSLLL
ncbi:MAG: IclR family transcriptional regulator [Deltaproteobacteria bacterium]|nr:IclR family transcriptional regulator [Deltaproteobacteria bacterium]